MENTMTGKAQKEGGMPVTGSPAPAGVQYPFGQTPAAGWGYYYGPIPAPRKSRKPAIAGGFLIFIGVMSIILGVLAGTVMVGMISGNAPFGESSAGEIRGQVIYENSTPAENCTITVVETGQLAITNSTGHYRILSVATGNHELRVELSGYKTITYKMSVTPTMRGPAKSAIYRVVDFQMHPGEGTIQQGSSNPSEEWGIGFAKNMMSVCSVIWVAFGIIIIYAGICAMKRQRYPVAVVGAVLGIMTPLFILAIIMLILLLLAVDEFSKKGSEEGRPPLSPPPAPVISANGPFGIPPPPGSS